MFFLLTYYQMGFWDQQRGADLAEFIRRLLHDSGANYPPLGTSIGRRWFNICTPIFAWVIKCLRTNELTSPARPSMATCKLCPPNLEGCYLCCETGPHRYIPRRPYVPRQGAWEGAFDPMKITFRKAGQCGILVRDAISKNFRDLERRDSRPFEGVDIADQVTLRIEVSGRALVGVLYSDY